jgi:hypothetical protein
MVEVMAKRKDVKGSFTGSIQIIGGSHVVFTDMKGHVGKLKLAGHGFGSISGNQFQGASLLLTGQNGTLTVDLFFGTIKKQGKNGTFKTVFVVEGTTGAYGPADGSAGTFVVTIHDLKNWYKQTKELMTDTADVNSLSDAAYLLLNSTNLPKR